MPVGLARPSPRSSEGRRRIDLKSRKVEQPGIYGVAGTKRPLGLPVDTDDEDEEDEEEDEEHNLEFGRLHLDLDLDLDCSLGREVTVGLIDRLHASDTEVGQKKTTDGTCCTTTRPRVEEGAAAAAAPPSISYGSYLLSHPNATRTQRQAALRQFYAKLAS